MPAFAEREDDVDGFAVRDVPFDLVEEADELLMPPLVVCRQTTAGQRAALHVLANDRAIQHVERGKERGRAVALVVVGHGGSTTFLQREAGLGPPSRAFKECPAGQWSSACICDFSSTDSTTAWAGGAT